MNAFGPSMELDHMRNMKCYKPSAEEVLKKYFNPQLSNAENLALATERHGVVKAINDVSTTCENVTEICVNCLCRTLASSRSGSMRQSFTTSGKDER